MIRTKTLLANVEHLSVTFQGRATPAVDDISFDIHEGECVALVGESGSGKSLTARALLGLLPQGSTRTGEIILGEDPAPSNGATAWAGIRGARAALVPQEALGGLDPLRRLELEVGDALRLHRIVPRRARRERVIGALASAGMPLPEQQLRRRSDELSGGLRQRGLVASALIAEPELIIADEPTTALDSAHRGRVLDELQRRAQAGAGVLLISHDLASVRAYADRVLVMKNGRVVEQGDPEAVFNSPTHQFTRDLIAATPEGKARGIRLLIQQRDSRISASNQPPATVEPSADGLTPSTGSAPIARSVPSTPRLELQEVSTGYGSGNKRKNVLESLSLSVHAGETVGLVGESGSGKTTLLRVALGLHTLSSGRALIDGVDRSSANRSEKQRMRRRIALVPQDPLDSFPRGASGRVILEDALRAAGIVRSERNARAIALATEVDLDESLLAQPAATLSGGQRQRLAIARALARSPELLLLDEPVSALDITVQARVLDLLDDLQEHRGTAYLFVTHDADVITHMSDRVLLLKDGAIHER